jgi:hypothetical protein
MQLIARPTPIKRSQSAPAGAKRIKTKEEKARNVLKKAIENGLIKQLLWDGGQPVARSNEPKPEISNETKDDTFMNDVKLFNSVLMSRVMHSKSKVLEDEYKKMKKQVHEVTNTSISLQNSSMEQKPPSHRHRENSEEDYDEIDETEEKKEIHRLNEALLKFQKQPSAFLSPSSPSATKKNPLISPRKKKIAMLSSKTNPADTKGRLLSPGRKPPSKSSSFTPGKPTAIDAEIRKSSKTEDFDALPGLIPSSSSASTSKNSFYFGTSLKKPRRVFDIIKSTKSKVDYIQRYLPKYNNRTDEEEEERGQMEEETEETKQEMDSDNPFTFMDNPEVMIILLLCY